MPRLSQAEPWPRKSSLSNSRFTPSVLLVAGSMTFVSPAAELIR